MKGGFVAGPFCDVCEVFNVCDMVCTIGIPNLVSLSQVLYIYIMCVSGYKDRSMDDGDSGGGFGGGLFDECVVEAR